MAVMWPRKLPPDVLSNPLRSAEIEVYERLKAELDDTWHVFYSRPWLGLTTSGEEIDGESDFVLAHAQHGMLCVEVKGGTIAWDPLSNQWSSRDRWKITHLIKDPVAQARSSKHELLKKLKDQPGMQDRWVRVRHGVIFPHCGAPARDLGPDRPLFIFCFYDEFQRDLSAWVHSRFTVAEERSGLERGLGIDGMNALQALLAKPLTLRTPLAQQVRSEDRELEYLTQQQHHLLLSIAEVQRVCVQGGAGTGKTVLAAHLARLLAEGGLRTLFVCYNEPLASRLSTQHHDCKGLLVTSFHSLCSRILKTAGIAAPVCGADQASFFESTLPDAAGDAASMAGVPRFDAIIVDEGQDFREMWWLVIEALLAKDGPKMLRIFFDTNQRVYSTAAGIVRDLELAPIHLSWNLRNTQAVHAAAYRFYTGREVSSKGPEGEPPIPMSIDDAGVTRIAVGKLINRLINQEAMDPEELAVIVPDETWKARVASNGTIAGFPITDASQARAGCVTLDTVRRFKGLESCIIIIVASEGLSNSDELCYVGLSRGRTRAFVVGLEKHVQALASG